jgi:hypothetical protein
MAVRANDFALFHLGEEALDLDAIRSPNCLRNLEPLDPADVVQVHDIRRETLPAVGTGAVLGVLNDFSNPTTVVRTGALRLCALAGLLFRRRSLPAGFRGAADFADPSVPLSRTCDLELP